MSLVQKGNTQLPDPVSITSASEIIWSPKTGRTASGKMLGDVIATKSTFSITWQMLSQAQVNTITSALVGGFYNVTVAGTTVAVYRGTIQLEHLGTLSDNVYYYRSVRVDLVQQ